MYILFTVCTWIRSPPLTFSSSYALSQKTLSFSFTLSLSDTAAFGARGLAFSPGFSSSQTETSFLSGVSSSPGPLMRSSNAVIQCRLLYQPWEDQTRVPPFQLQGMSNSKRFQYSSTCENCLDELLIDPKSPELHLSQNF